jgi:hypothetical protein
MAGAGLEYDGTGPGDNCGAEPGGGYGGVESERYKGPLKKRAQFKIYNYKKKPKNVF